MSKEADMKIYNYTEKDIETDLTCITGNPEDLLFFDIETTGLSARSSDLYMIGLGSCLSGTWQTTLLFNDDGSSEPEMLEYFSKKASGHSFLISYNGDTFDIPYMKTKLDQFGISFDMSSLSSVDIYKIIRKHKKLLGLGSARQIDTEKLAGFKRKSFISGGDLISEYKSFLGSRYRQESDSDLLNDLLTHNRDDIRGLMSVSEFAWLPHLAELSDLSSVRCDEEYVYYSCHTHPIPCRILATRLGTILDVHDRQLLLTVPLVHGAMKYYFKNYRDYYYLPKEHTAIHKSVAAYVDSAYKEKATRSTACVEKNSRFIPAIQGFSGDVFFDGGPDGRRYAEFDGSLSSEGEAALTYVRLFISEFLSG